MNSDAKRILSHFDNSRRPDLHQDYYSLKGLWERLQTSTTLLAFVAILSILYIRFSQHGRAPRFTFLWDFLVFIIPAKLIYALERWLDPPLFPAPMLAAQTTSYEAKSEALRKVLGLNKPGGLLMSVSQVGRKSLTGFSGTAFGRKNMNDQPAGLGNNDNSCYQNSILQGLASLSPIPSYLSCLSGPTDGRRVERTTEALQALIANLNDPANNGRTLWTPGVLKNMSTWQQQDAQEYYSKLLDEVDKEIAKAIKRLQKPSGLEGEPPADDTSTSQHSDDSGYQSASSNSRLWPEPRLSRNPLEGLVAQRVACVACGYCEGLSMIPFNCLTLNLGNRAQHDLLERLDSYTKVEQITGVECAKCSLLKAQSITKGLLDKLPDHAGVKERLVAIEEALEDDAFDDKTLTEKCKISPKQRVTSTKTKQVVISRPPRSLAIHMNRSVFDENTGRMYKNLATVRFPKFLDLGPWCLGSADDAMSENTLGQGRDEEQWLLDPLSSMVAGDTRPSKITGPIYELRAVVTHYGQHENGHYVCFRRHSTPSRASGEGVNGKPPQLATEGDDLPSLDGLSLEDDPKIEDVVEIEADKTEKSTSADSDGDRTVTITEVEDGKEDDSAYEDELTTDWWRLSDHDVSKVDESTVLAQGGVFMLFYDCVDPESVRLFETDALVATSAGSSAIIHDVVFNSNQSDGASIPLNSMSNMVQDGDLVHAATIPLPSDGDDGL